MGHRTDVFPAVASLRRKIKPGIDKMRGIIFVIRAVHLLLVLREATAGNTSAFTGYRALRCVTFFGVVIGIWYEGQQTRLAKSGFEQLGTVRDWSKSTGSGGPKHLEMWWIKNTWPTPSFGTKLTDSGWKFYGLAPIKHGFFDCME